MRLKHYEAVSVTVGEIVIISKCYPNVSVMMIGLSLNNNAHFLDMDKYNII